jgi:glycosyltransferase involved in cell wall biosynthesis/SAM-dependent methyltransferase
MSNSQSLHLAGSDAINLGHVIHNYKPLLGGGELYVQDLICRLPPRFHHVVFQQASEVKSPEIRPVTTGLIRGFRKNLQVRYLRELFELDLLICHDLTNFLRLFASKSICVCHGVNWRNPGSSHRRNERIRSRAARAYEKSLAIVANDTDFFREMGVRGAEFESCRFAEVERGRWLLPNCVDTDMFSPGPALEHIARLKPVIVPRRVAPERGIGLAVEAFHWICRWDNSMMLLVVGDHSDRKYASQLAAQIENLGLVGRVIFLGRVSREHMPALYRSSFCALIPTLHSEGTSLSALEAMACRCPTFSTPVGGLNDIPTEKTPSDAKGMAERLLESLPRMGQIALRQRELVQTRFSMPVWEAAWTKVIETCLSRAPSAKKTPCRLRSGIPQLEEYLALLKTPLFSHIEGFSNRFLNENQRALKYYSQRWCSDPLHHWSRQWEYPFVLLALQAFARESPGGLGRVLDAGSGATFFPFLVGSSFPGSSVICCDEDEKLANIFDQLKQKTRNPVRFDAVGLQELPYADASLDVIYSISVLEHTEDHETILREFLRTLKPGGRLILTFDIELDRKAAIDADKAMRLLALIETHFAGANNCSLKGLSEALVEEDILTTQRVNRFSRARWFWNYTAARYVRTLLAGRLPVRPSRHKSSNLTVYCAHWRKAPQVDITKPSDESRQES